MNFRELILRQNKEAEENKKKRIIGDLHNIVCHNLQKNCNLDLVDNDMTDFINKNVSLDTKFNLYYSCTAKQKLLKTEIWSYPCDQSYKLIIDSDELRKSYDDLLEQERIDEIKRMKGESIYKHVQKENFKHQDLLSESINNVEIIDPKPKIPCSLVVKQIEHYSSCYSIRLLVPGTKYKWNYIEEKSHNSIIMSEIYDKKICKESFKSNYEDCPIFKPVNAIIDESKVKVTNMDSEKNNKIKDNVDQKNQRLTKLGKEKEYKDSKVIKNKHEEDKKKEEAVSQFIDMKRSKESVERMNLIVSTIEKKTQY